MLLNKETISDKHGISLVILFLSGTSSILEYGLQAKNDVWLAIMLSTLLGLVMAISFSYLHSLFPGKDFYDIVRTYLGKLTGNIIIALYIWYIYHSASIVVRNAGQFINIVILNETPLIIILVSIVILCIWSVKKGIELIGGMADFFILPFTFFIIITILLLITSMDINNLRPFLYNGIKPVTRAAFLTFSFPFGEIVTFSMVFSSFKNKKSPYKVYIIGTLIGGAIIMATSLMGILVLGSDTALSFYYPSYIAISRINIGGFLQRLEIIAAVIFMLGAFVKISIYLLACCRGISTLFNCPDYRFIATPVGLLIINLSYFIYGSIMEFLEWDLEIWPYYSLLFQAILPIIILASAIIRKKLSSSN